MVGSKDLPPSTTPFYPNIFFRNQFIAKPQWPAPGTTLSGKTTIVTGSNTGLGYEAARQLLALNLSRLILAVRSPEKGEAAAAALRSLHPTATIEVWPLDMTLYTSIQAFANRASTDLTRIDIVILNAGIYKLKYGTVPSTGHEEVFQVNYLSTVLLAVLLLPILKSKSRNNKDLQQTPHITIVSAALTLNATIPNPVANQPLISSLNHPTNPREEQYTTSKLLAHMFLWKLVDFVSASDVIVNLADPAWCKGTSLSRDLTNPLLKVFIKLFGAATGRTKEVGASCFVDAVVNKGQESHGCFLMSWGIHPFPALLYTPEGKVAIDRLWDETLAELDFAGIRAILDSMKG
ncbi:hypothetical protein B0T17DRAFT_617218 [Bombardia bombarda]|uniref:Uncharacterized protein n=1 Tax=Bombardia bombarda TaxID=252184 RepID=A0AA39X0L5_9PEZI|nr:hypothetical protein B0T17DRAFT_617218 [Bombardia bombarda]